MISGAIAGVTWGIETVIMGLVLQCTLFKELTDAILVSSFMCAFLHDGCSAVFSILFNCLKGRGKTAFQLLFTTNSGQYVALASILGGPVGMTGYMMTIKYMGAAVGAIATAAFPAIGTVLAVLFLKEKMYWSQYIFLLVTLTGVYGLSYSPELTISNYMLGIAGAFMCSLGWSGEAVILAKCLKNNEIQGAYALQIRQTISAVFTCCVILPALGGGGIIVSKISMIDSDVFIYIAAAGFFATVSYLFYYKAISEIGAAKAMALDISYTAWAGIFSIVILKEYSIISPVTICCFIMVIFGGLLTTKKIIT